MPTYHMIGWQLQSGAKHLLLGDSTHHAGDLVDSVMKYDADEHGATPPMGCCCTEGEECPCGSTPTSFPSLNSTLTITFTARTGDCATCLPASKTLTYNTSDVTGCGFTGNIWWGQLDATDGCGCANEGGPVGAWIGFMCIPLEGYSPGYQIVWVCPTTCDITPPHIFGTATDCSPVTITGSYTYPGSGTAPCTGSFTWTITE